MRANLLNVLASERCGGGNRVDRRNDVASVTAERCGVGSHLGWVKLMVTGDVVTPLPGSGERPDRTSGGAEATYRAAKGLHRSGEELDPVTVKAS